ncbi:MAG: hypothetical protein ABII22_02605 [Candidatus Micrarchaeota archaeon]
MSMLTTKNLFFFLILLTLTYASLNNPQEQEQAQEGLTKLFSDMAQEAKGVTGGVVHTLFGAFQPSSCGAEDTWLNFGTMNWLIPSVFVAMVVLFGITILYMMGNLFQLQNLILVAKEEYFNSFATVLRVILVLGAVATVDAAWYGLQTNNLGPDPDPVYSSSPVMIDAALVFSYQTMTELNSVFSNLLMFNMVVHTLYTSTLYFGVTWRAMYSFNLGPVLKPIIDILGVSMNMLSVAIGEWVIHMATLCIIKKWAFTLFIPLGMLLRAIPHTRAGGEALFALVFAFAVIYPFMFIVDYEAHKILKSSILDPTENTLMTDLMEGTGLFKVATMMVAFFFLSGGVFVPVLVEAGLSITFELVNAAVYYIVILGLLLPFINIFITLTAAKEFAKGWGGVDINYMAFVRLI